MTGFDQSCRGALDLVSGQIIRADSGKIILSGVQSDIRELKMRRFSQHRRRPEVNQAVVDGVAVVV